MRSAKTILAAAAVLAAACSDFGSDASDSRVSQTRQALHGPIPNVHVRLLNGQGHDSVVCNPLVKGLTPSLTSTYRTTITVTYPSAAVAQKVGTVSLASPSHVNNTNGKFALDLLEMPTGSGEYAVKAEFKRRTTERTDGIHRCEVQIDEDSDGDTVFETEWVNNVGEASHQATQSGPWHQSTSHRVSNGHVICQSRLNFANQFAIHYVDVSVTTSAGTGSIADFPFGFASPPLPFSMAGGTGVIEWGVPPGQFPQPSLDVRFDFVGQRLGSTSTCTVMIKEGDAFIGPTVLDGHTSMVEEAPTCGPATLCAAGDGCCPSACLPITDADCPGCGNGAVEDGEACDDGTGFNFDGCENDCTLSPTLTGTWSGVTEQGQPMAFTVENNTITGFAWLFDDGIMSCGYNNIGAPGVPLLQPVPIMPGGTFGGSAQDGSCNPCFPVDECSVPLNYSFSGSFASGTNASGTVGGPGICCYTDITLTWTASRL